MFTCTICGLKKTKLANNSSEFEFRRRRQQDDKAYVNGISEWCPKCKYVRFFFWIDDKKEPAQHLDEPPKKQQFNQTLEAAATRQGKGKKITSTSQERRIQNKLCREAHTQLKREIIEGLPAKLPLDCLWQRPIRSQSEARGRGRNTENSDSRQRSKSVVHELTQKTRQAKQQAEQRSCLSKQMGKLGSAAKPPIKDIYLEDQANDREGVVNNYLQEQDNEEAGTSRAGKRQKPKPSADIIKQLQLADRWQEEVQKHTNSLLNSFKKTAANKPNPTKNEPSKLVTKRFTAGTFAKPKKPTIDEVEIESDEEIKEQLKNQLVEKKLLVDEWECIRRRVNNECHRVNAELDELKYEADLETERNRLGKLTRQERQLGGAQLRSLNRSFEQQDKGEAKNWTAATESILADALNERLKLKLDTLQEKRQPFEGEQLKNVTKNILTYSKNSAVKKSVKKRAVTKLTKMNIKNSSAYVLPKVSERRLRTGLRQKHLLSKLNFMVSNVQRACFRGFPKDPQQQLNELTSTNTYKLRHPPPAQFTTKPCSSKELCNLIRLKPQLLERKSLKALKVCRAPIICPDVDCRGMFFISDFNAHLQHEHPTLAMERIKVGHPKTFFLDTHIALQSRAKCQMVYFVKNKIIDDQYNKQPDLLPVLVMTAKARMLDIFGANYKDVKEIVVPETMSDTDVFMMWLTSVRPEDSKIVGTISVWPTCTKPMMECLNVHTSQMYNIRSSQKLNHIFKSNCVMTLPGNYINSITNNGKYMLAVQVQIH